MQYKTFGRRTGLRVSEFALGTGNFGTGWGHGSEPAEARRIFDRYVEAGGNFIDTANGYQFGESEKLVGEFIGGDRDSFVLATKYSLRAAPDDRTSILGNSRRNLIRSVEESLKRLNTDHIDLLWAHFDDRLTPMEEILRGFDDLVRSGKIHYAGLSNFPAWRIARGATLADAHSWAPIVGVQIEHSLVERTAERELLPMAESLGLAVALWSPLGGGFLTGKYRQNETGRREALNTLVHGETDAQKTAILDTVLTIAAETGYTPSQVAVAWIRRRGELSPTAHIPIIGPRTIAQLEDYLGALDATLSAEQLERLTAVSAIRRGTPHDQIDDVVDQMTGLVAHGPVPVA